MDDLLEYLKQPDNSQRQLARDLGLSQGAIHKWLKSGRIPAERVVEVERVTGISRQSLRPDLFDIAA